MDSPLVLEICGAEGRLRERHKLRSFPVAIGRSYENDIIIDDPFVCGAHLLIESGAGEELTLRDRGSINGLYLLPDETRVESLTVRPGLTARIGHTVLRFVSTGEPVAPARRDHRINAKTLRQLGRPTFSLILLMLLVIMQWALFFELSYHEESEQSLAGFLAVTIGLDLALLVAWSGAWALVSRISVHQSHFFRHAAAALLSGLLLVTLRQTCAYLGFALNLASAATILRVLGSVAVAGAQLGVHLSLTTRWSLRRGTMVGLLVASSIAGIVGAASYASSLKFSSEVPLAETLKPPAFKLAAGSSVDEFIAAASRLKQPVDRQARRRQGE